MTEIDPKLRKALAGISGILVTPFDAADKIAPGAPEADRRPCRYAPACTSWSPTATPASSTG